MRTIYAHLHIPKCGGSTVLNFLSRNFHGPKLASTNGVLNDYQYDASQVARIIDQFPELKCITGHKLSLQLPFERSDLEIRAFTFIRDPVERFFSHYFFHRNHTTLVPEAKTMNLDSYIGWALEDGNQKNYINGQTKFLALGDLDLIKRSVAAKRLILFPLSHLTDSLFTLSTLYPDDFTDIKTKILNVSIKDQSIPANLRSRVLKYVSDDYELLTLANQTNLNTKTKMDIAWHHWSGWPIVSRPIHKLGRVLVRCGNHLSRFG